MLTSKGLVMPLCSVKFTKMLLLVRSLEISHKAKVLLVFHRKTSGRDVGRSWVLQSL